MNIRMLMTFLETPNELNGLPVILPVNKTCIARQEILSGQSFVPFSYLRYWHQNGSTRLTPSSHRSTLRQQPNPDSPTPRLNGHLPINHPGYGCGVQVNDEENVNRCGAKRRNSGRRNRRK